jgi:hypothetical protein
MSLSQTYLTKNWYEFLEDEGKSLVRLSLNLLEREERLRSSLSDYSFVVFPIAKAYEGFLKQFLYAQGLIDRNQFEHRQFRIGRSLNPDVSFRHQDEFWLYDDIANACSEDLAREMWAVWIDARNHLFHYFPDMRYKLTLEQSHILIDRMSQVMGKALQCVAHKKKTGQTFNPWEGQERVSQ